MCSYICWKPHAKTISQVSSLVAGVVHGLFSSTVDILKKTTVDKLPNDLEGMEASMEHLHALMEDAYKYVDGVLVSFFPVLFVIFL